MSSPSSFTYAFYSFGGVELVALAAGESQKPHKSVPRAIKATFARIVIFYVMVVLVIGLNINHNDESLFDACVHCARTQSLSRRALG